VSDRQTTAGWFYRRGGDVIGPLSRRQLWELAEAGELHPRETLWGGRSPSGELLDPTRVATVLRGGRLALLLIGEPCGPVVELLPLVRQWGYDARLAVPGAQAVRAARTCEPDAVIIDLDVPGLDRGALAAALRERAREGPPVLVGLTRDDSPEGRRQTTEAGFRHQLVKPVDPNVLTLLLALVSQERASPPAVPADREGGRARKG
jgi:CheY-like chemotaxis protein